MEINILATQTHTLLNADIKLALKKDMPLKKNAWNFNWKSLYKTEGAEIYKLSLIDDSSELQGLIMLSLMNDEMLYLNNIEVAPHNIGLYGKYDYVAGCLLAYGCLKSFDLGKNAYKGYLTFESKTQLITLYQQKYGATLIGGHKMFIAPEIGLQLIKKYLNR